MDVVDRIVGFVRTHAGVVWALIRAGAHLDVKDRNDMSAKNYAERNRHGVVVKMLNSAPRESIPVLIRRGVINLRERFVRR